MKTAIGIEVVIYQSAITLKTLTDEMNNWLFRVSGSCQGVGYVSQSIPEDDARVAEK